VQWLQNDHEKILIRGDHEYALDILYRESVVYPKTNFPLADYRGYRIAVKVK